MKIKEFIEQDLKKVYESCLVYFDIQESSIIIKNLISKEQKAEWDKEEPELRQLRVKIQEARSRGITDLSEEPPQHWEDVYKDSKYQLGENYFRWLITKLDEWETSQNKRVENISLLINFLEWVATEEERLTKEKEEAQKKVQSERMKDIISQVLGLKVEGSGNRVEDSSRKKEEYDKKIEKLESDEDKINRKIEKYKKQIERMKNGEDISSDEDEDSEDEFLLEEDEVRNILLIGRTGSGKSTLANVLVNKNNNFEEVFKESAASVSETKHVQTEKFTVDLSRDRTEKVNYLVIDTAGFGDTQLGNKDILKLLQNLIPIVEQDGLNQIFFVTGGRFTQSEIETYKLLESVLFDKEATKYTTIVRTNFEDFENSKAREEDEQDLRKENPEIFKILQASKIIYVDNPRMVGRSAITNKEIRKESRKRLLTYLGTCQDNYYPADLENLGERIDDYITSEEELKKEIELREQIVQEERAELQKEVERIQTQKNRELKITERNFERQTQELKNQNRKKLEATRQELDEAHRLQLQGSREAYNKKMREAKKVIQDNLNQIRDNYNYVKVGKPVCRYGHDRNIKTYDKLGSLILDYQSDFIGHIYCPTCGTTDYNFTLRDAKTYSLEELGRRNSQQAAERRRKMQEAFDEQNRKEQEVIDRINQEKTNRDTEITKNIQERKRLQEQVDIQQEKIRKELEQQKQISKGKIASGSQEKVDELKRELAEKEQALEEHIKQSEEKRNAAQQELYAYIEQRKS